MSKAGIVLREIEGMTEREFLPILGPHKGQILVEVIREIKPKRVLEVGTLIGYSAILMGKELGSDAHLITIEIHADYARMAEENIRKAKIQPKVEVLIGDAIEVLSRLKVTFDLVFIDADKRQYLNYLQLIEDKLHKGSVIVADNAGIFANQMRDYLDYVRSSGKYRSRYVPVSRDGLEVSVKL
ncbi:MAG: O-methyltransferase [Candidatus Bathyarchaeia archaeon]